MLAWIRNSPELLRALEEMVITHLPGPQGYALRYEYWKKRLAHLGDSVLIDTGVYFQNPQFISIGDNCWIDKNVMILAGHDDSTREKIVRGDSDRVTRGHVSLGKNIHIAPSCIISGIAAGVVISDDCTLSAHCKLYALSHHYRSGRNPGDMRITFGTRTALERQCLIEGPIFLGTNTGVALNSVILPGTTIAENSFVAINSVITHGSFEPNSLIAGNPAKRIGPRYKSSSGGAS